METSQAYPTDLLTVAEVAAILRVSERTVYRLVVSGGIPSQRVGRSHRVSREWLESRYLRQPTIGHAR